MCKDLVEFTLADFFKKNNLVLKLKCKKHNPGKPLSYEYYNMALASFVGFNESTDFSSLEDMKLCCEVNDYLNKFLDTSLEAVNYETGIGTPLLALDSTLLEEEASSTVVQGIIERITENDKTIEE